MPTRADLVRTIQDQGVADERILEAFRNVSRADFVPREHIGRAYVDVPLPIPHGQVTTQPSLVARMLEALDIHSSDTVLEIGTGYGFQTALLARLAARVVSIERFEYVAVTARDHLIRAGMDNAEVFVGDGSCGLREHAPYDAIIVSAAFPRVPVPLVEQLAEGGRLVQPIGPGGADDVRRFEKLDSKLVDRGSVIGAHFVRLYGRYGYAIER